MPHDLPCAVPAQRHDVGKRHAVKGIVLHHGVDRHVPENEPVSGAQRLVKRIVADDVSRKAGRSAKPVGICLPAGLPLPQSGGL